MGLIEEYKIEKIGDRQEYEVKVRIKGAEHFVGLPDVGFGVSQVLPMLVQLFYAPDNSVIFMDTNVAAKAATPFQDCKNEELDMCKAYVDKDEEENYLMFPLEERTQERRNILFDKMKVKRVPQLG